MSLRDAGNHGAGNHGDWGSLADLVLSLAASAVEAQRILTRHAARDRAWFRSELDKLPREIRELFADLTPPTPVIDEFSADSAIAVRTSRETGYGISARPLNAYYAVVSEDEMETSSRIEIEVKALPPAGGDRKENTNG